MTDSSLESTNSQIDSISSIRPLTNGSSTELNNNRKNSNNTSETKNSSAVPKSEFLSPADRVNIENNRAKYFSGLKSNLQADMETFLELIWALCYLVYGVTVSFILIFIPRRFRYKDVSGQVVLVTGAGSGIGRMMAKKLALNHGATIVAWDINKQGNDETVKEIKEAGGNAFGYVVDVSSRASIYEAADKVKAEVGKVEILINNAGIVSGRPFLDTPDHLIEKTMQVNVNSNFWTIKAFLPAMMKDGHGHIVTIASTAGLIGVNRLVDYCTSKYAQIGLTEAIQNELRSEKGYEKIYTTVVCPYFINTGMFDGVRSKIIPILKPENVVNDVVAGILTNQEQVVMPRWLYPLLCMKMALPGEVGRRVASALGINGTMMGFKGRVGTAAPTSAKLK